jgi:hypothetical protein
MRCRGKGIAAGTNQRRKEKLGPLKPGQLREKTRREAVVASQREQSGQGWPGLCVPGRLEAQLSPGN